MSILSKLQDVIDLNEGEKPDNWVGKVKPKRGKMHELLNIPEDKTISSKYKSGAALAKALVRALNGDEKKASSMLAFAANADSAENVLDSALSYMKKIGDKKKD
jgi:hypothetical protein